MWQLWTQKKSTETVSEEKIQKMIAWRTGNTVFALQTQIMNSETENSILDETNTTVQTTQKDESLDSLLQDKESFNEFSDSLGSKFYRMEEAIIANSSIQKAFLFSQWYWGFIRFCCGSFRTNDHVFRKQAKTEWYYHKICYKEIAKR